MSVIVARPGSRKDHMRKPQGKRVGLAKQRGTWQKNLLSSINARLRFLLWKLRRLCSLQSHRRAYVCCWFRWFYAHAEQERFQLRRNGDSAEIQEPHNGCCSQWGRWNKRGSTSIRTRLRSLLDCAITRGNASSSSAWWGFAKSTDFHMSGSAVKNHGWPQMGRKLFAKLSISYLLSYQVCHSLPGAAPLQHRECRIWRPQRRKIQTKLEVTRQLRETGAGQIHTGCTGMIDCNFLNGVRVHTKSGGPRNSCAHTYFSGLRFGMSYERGRKIQIKEAWYFCSLRKCRDCDVCLRTKLTRAPCRRRTGEALPRAEKFGDMVTADHNVLDLECEFRNNHRHAIVVQDLAT